MNMTPDFFSLCQRVGHRIPQWVQGAGGNVSQKLRSKDSSFLRIKASGYRLDQVDTTQGFVDLDLEMTQARLAKVWDHNDPEAEYANLLSQNVLSRAKANDRASMETSFHLSIDSTFVIHFHSLAAILLAELHFRNDPRVEKFLAHNQDLSCCFIDFVKPGLELARAIEDAPRSNAYFLRNHGIVLGLDRAEDLDLWIGMENRMIAALGWDSLLDTSQSTLSSPWPLRVLMPDLAVFLRQLQAQLVEDTVARGRYHLRQSPNNENIRELWEATTRLLAIIPDMVEISPEKQAAIAGLPTEKYRQQLKETSYS